MVAGLTMLSRVLGLVRDHMIMRLGAGRATDSFWAAFSIPNLFRRLFGEGALSAAFVPVFTEVLETEGLDRARVVLANAAGLLALVLAGILVLVELGLGVWLLAAGNSAEWDRLLLVKLIAIVMPFMLTICLLALASAALQCRGRFAYPAFAPMLLNVCMIAAAVVGIRADETNWMSLALLSASVVVAGVLQLIGAVWLLARVELPAAMSLRPVLPEVRRIVTMTIPMMVPLGVLQFSAFFDRMYAWWMTATRVSPNLELLGWQIARPLEPGVVTCLYAGNRLYQFPLGILAISLATTVFPLFSRYASRGDLPSLRIAANRALRLSVFLGLPAGAALVILAQDSIALIYGHGRFEPNDVVRSARILQMYSLGMWAYFCNHILLRAFFAQKDTRTPLWISCGLAGLNMLLVAGGIFTPLRGASIGLATAVTATINTLLLTWILRRRWGRIHGRVLAISVLRTSICTGLMVATLLAMEAGVRQKLASPTAGTAGLAMYVAAACAGGTGIYLVAAVVLRAPEIGELLNRSGPKRG
ncbi:MAG: murein biosynthesis integral membrane protein MurJ [Planctomycetota bacterium]